MDFWGITGTNGKTTTTWIFAEFLNACAGRKCGYLTTVEVNTGTRRFYTGYTTPPLAQQKEIFAEMEANGCTDCVMEVSSHAIHQHRTGDTVFAGGAFTNLSEDHLDYHKTMEAYFDVKLDFARQIAASQADRTAKRVSAEGAEQAQPYAQNDRADRTAKRVSAEGAEQAQPYAPHLGRRELAPYVVCLDGGYGREMFNAVGNLPLNVIGATIGNGTSGTGGTTGTCRPDYDLSELPLAGAYNRSNVLTAAALAEAAGVPHEVIQGVIPTLKPRWGRLELVENSRVAAKVYVDFAHTPDGLEKVLTAVRNEMKQFAHSNIQTFKHSNNSLWVVFGAGGDRDPMKRPLMGAACAKLADRLVVTSDNPRSEDPLVIIDAILAGIPETARSTGEATSTSLVRDERVHIDIDRREAIAYALAHAQAGDVVVIAGKGHETTQEIKGVKHPFDDREIVRAFGA